MSFVFAECRLWDTRQTPCLPSARNLAHGKVGTLGNLGVSGSARTVSETIDTFYQAYLQDNRRFLEMLPSVSTRHEMLSRDSELRIYGL